MPDDIRRCPLNSSVSGATSNGTAFQHHVFPDCLKEYYKSVEIARVAEATAEKSWRAAQAEVNKALLDQNLALQKHWEDMIKSVQQGNIGGSWKEAESASFEQQLRVTTGSTSLQRKPKASFGGSGAESGRNSERNSSADPQHLLSSSTNEPRQSLSLPTANTPFCATCGVQATRQHLCSPQHLMSEYWSATGKLNLEPSPSTSSSAAQKSRKEMTTSGRTALQTGSQQHWYGPEDPNFQPFSDEPWHEV